MRLSDAAVPTFARHETFHPRYGWFRKAYTASAEDPDVFAADDAPVRLGVGKNMVRSIRFWGQAAKVIAPETNPSNPRSPGMAPTCRGVALFGADGWDPFMEDPGTSWLLHWLLLAPPTHLPVWWLAFNSFDPVEFDPDRLEESIFMQLGGSGWDEPHPSSVRKDLSALLRTYAPDVSARRSTIDDLVNCPLRDLGLIKRSASGALRVAIGPKLSLPVEAFVYCVLDYLARLESSRRSISSTQLVTEPGAPGRAFRLRIGDVADLIRSTTDIAAAVEWTTTNGDVQLILSEEPSIVARDVLNAYYGTAVEHDSLGWTGDQPCRPELIPDEDTASMSRLRRLSAAVGG